MLTPISIRISADSTVSAVLAAPDAAKRPDTAVILAHGAGADMHAPLLSAVHAGLAQRGFLTVKFNFPYTERGRRAPDRAPVLEACYERVIDALRADPQGAPRHLGAPHRLVIGGKSMGGRMASHIAAAGVAVDGLVFLGYPLHPAGRPDQLRVAHLTKIGAPMLFFAGTRDPLCRLDLLHQTIDALHAAGHSNVHLHIIEGGDHSFELPRKMGRAAEEVWRELIDVTQSWMEKNVITSPPQQ